MQIQVNSGNSVAVDEKLVRMAESLVRRSLARYEDRLTRIEVHLNDVNSHKSGALDKRCQIEARPAGLDPVSASSDAETLEAATRAAAQKLERLLDSLFGRLSDRR